MEFERSARPTPQINLSALIDIAFILVIFIVLAANFQRVNEMGLSLPESDSRQVVESKALEIQIPVAGAIHIDGQPCADDQLRARLTQLRKTHKSVVLIADREAAIQRAITAMNEAQRAGFRAVSIATRGSGT